MVSELKNALAVLDADPETKIIVIRSKHDKIFCAGGNIKSFAEKDYTVYPFNVHFFNVSQAFRAVRKPIVSVV
jgi:enoyl-CoA hydratase/carnithine racemase